MLPTCAFLECGCLADWVIYPEEDEGLEFHSCTEHLGPMLDPTEAHVVLSIDLDLAEAARYEKFQN